MYWNIFFSDNISYLGFLMDYDQHISHYVQTRCLNFAQMNMMTRKIAGSYDTMATKLTSPVTTRVRNAFEVMWQMKQLPSINVSGYEELNWNLSDLS